MLFNSIRFLIFFPAVVILYYLLPQKQKKVFLLIASYVFYMNWNAKYALLILFSTGITYLSGLLIEHARQTISESTERQRRMKWILIGSLVSNLGILFVFKYFNFMVDILTDVAVYIGKPLSLSGIDLILPVGISFYTFQALSYSIDVYRGEVPAERDFVYYALFVSFFPQLVAGPIERSGSLLKQLKKPAFFDFEKFCDGVLLMLWGYFLKIVIADRIAGYVDVVYAAPEQYPGFYLIVGTILFAFQLYCDFAGYSTIAMGTAKILGITLMDNFQSPFLATSIAELWRGWHISLTGWFRDYVYIPLGGNRRGKPRKYANILTVFLLSGLWHGASLSFVVWGLLNGLYQVVGELLLPLRKRFRCLLHLNPGTRIYCLLATLITFGLYSFSLIFFRAGSISHALLVLRNSLILNPSVLTDGLLFECGLDKANFGLVVLSVILLMAADGAKKKGITIRKAILSWKPWVSILVTGICIFLILVFGQWGPAFSEAGFIYFQF